MSDSSGVQRLRGLDGLRALSIGLVLVGHMIGTRGAPQVKWPRWLTLAELGVGVFFVISGFLITTLLLREREQTGAISLVKFYIRRSYRILPAAYVYIAVIAILALASIVVLKPFDLLHAVTYTMNFHQDRAWWLGHLWSLGVEEQFYFLWPALVVALSTRGAAWAALTGIVIAPVCRVAVLALWKSHSLAVGEWFPTICDGLATGCLLAIVGPRLGRSKAYLRFLGSPTFWLVPAGAITSMYLLTWLPLQVTVMPVVVNTSIALLIDRCMRFPDSAFVRAMEWRPLAWVGTLSYSLYLWQQPFVNRNSDAWSSHFPIYLPLAFGAAVASHYLVEKPALRLRARRAAAPATIAPPAP